LAIFKKILTHPPQDSFHILWTTPVWNFADDFFVQADGFVNFSQNFCSDMGGVLGKN
jgi:hypothetical protein